jgi:hypothetical protein
MGTLESSRPRCSSACSGFFLSSYVPIQDSARLLRILIQRQLGDSQCAKYIACKYPHLTPTFVLEDSGHFEWPPLYVGEQLHFSRRLSKDPQLPSHHLYQDCLAASAYLFELNSLVPSHECRTKEV